MKDRRDYERALKIIGDIIRSWDPYSLIAEGAPADEFDGEIARITARVASFRAPNDVAEAIAEVFSRSFAPDPFPAADCHGPARRIFLELGNADLLRAA